MMLTLAIGVQAANGGAVTANKSVYGNETGRIYMTFQNNGSQSITLSPSFTLERRIDGGWEPVPPVNLQDDYGNLDTAGVQYPVEAGTSADLGAYIGAYQTEGLFAPGGYRIVIRDMAGVEYAAEFTIVEGIVLADASKYVMQTERPAYDARINAIRLFLTNHSREHAGYGTGFSLQRQDGGKWIDVPFIPTNGKLFPAIGCSLDAQSSNWEIIPMDCFAQPFSPGRYRVLKTLNDDDIVAAEFTIIPESEAPRISFPDTFTLSGGEGFALVLVSGDDALETIYHELMAFQKSSAPVLPGDSYSLKFLSSANGRKQSMTLFAADDASYLQIDNQWYAAREGGVLNRIFTLADELGAYLPATGEKLLEAFQATDALKKVRFAPHRFTRPFITGGWLSDREESGVNLSIFKFPSAEQAKKKAESISDNGYGFLAVDLVGKEESGYRHYNWEQTPHFFRANQCLVLYCGEDAAVISAIESVLGPQFIGM